MRLFIKCYHGQALGATIKNKTDMVSLCLQNFTFKNTNCQLRVKDASFLPLGNKERTKNQAVRDTKKHIA